MTGTNLASCYNWIDIWQITLSPSEGDRGAYRRLLSADELDRADRFHFERHRQSFTARRAAMREILGWYTGTAPRELSFSYGTRGKPELAANAVDRHIRFNLSHCEGVALLAVACDLVLGIDIECVHRAVASEEIARRFFSRTEADVLSKLPTGERAGAFCSCWTRKEAYIKALGEGLYVPLDSFEVAFAPDTKPALLTASAEFDRGKRWSMYDVPVAPGYKAALVAEGGAHRLHRLVWPLQLPDYARASPRNTTLLPV